MKDKTGHTVVTSEWGAPDEMVHWRDANMQIRFPSSFARRFD
jgi:hypothetical protein